jgi:spore coat polysaccharide biosynthesis predicted glycosyltransferase SpsG
MRTFKLEQSKTEIITPHGGLALVGHSVNRMTSLATRVRQLSTENCLFYTPQPSIHAGFRFLVA